MTFLSCSQLMAQARMTVTNPSSMQRQELVAIDAQEVYVLLGISQGQPFVVSQVVAQKPDGSDKVREVDFQVTYDGKILIDASVQPGQTTEFLIERGVPRRIPNSGRSLIKQFAICYPFRPPTDASVPIRSPGSWADGTSGGGNMSFWDCLLITGK